MLTNKFTQQDTMYAIERAILATYIYADMSSEYDLIVNSKINYKSFATSLITKAVAKAIYIFQEEDKPLDKFLIARFVEKKMLFDYDEYTEILTTICLPYKTLLGYKEELDREKSEQERKNNYARI